MLSSSISSQYSKCSLPTRTFLSLVALTIGMAACVPSSHYKEKSQLNGEEKYQLVIASDSPVSGFVPAVLATTGESVYLSTDPADRIVKFDSLIPSIMQTGLHVSVWLSKGETNRLSEFTKKNVGKRIAFKAFNEVLTAAKIIRPMELTGGRISVGVTTDESNAIRLLNLFNAEKR